MQSETQKRFDTGKDPDGNKWKPLSENTIASRKKFNKGTKILNNTGALKRSIRRSSGVEYGRVFTNCPYGLTHQYGDKNRVIKPIKRDDPTKNAKHLKFYTANGWRKAESTKVTIPARPFMGISEKQRKKYLKMIYKFIYK